MEYARLTPAERAEWNDGYDAGMGSVEGAIAPDSADDPYALGLREGIEDRARFAEAAADRGDDELAAALDMDDPREPEHVAAETHWCRVASDNVPMPGEHGSCRWCGRTRDELRDAIAFGRRGRATFAERYAAARAERAARQAADGGELSIAVMDDYRSRA